MSNPDPSRRGLLRQAGATTLMVSGGVIATAGCSAAPSGAAYAPWSLWNDPALSGTPLALVAAGALAANPHDTQPWLFQVSESAIRIFADTARNLGAMDPLLREMHVGLGCAIQNMVLAARPNGYRAVVEVIAGDLRGVSDRRSPVPAATLHLTRLNAAAPPFAVYSAIPHRHTNRNPYDRRRALPPAWRTALNGLIDTPDVRLFLFEDGPARSAYDRLVLDATQAIIDDAPMIADSDRWVRRTDAEIETYRSGPTLEAQGLSPLTLMAAKAFPISKALGHKAWLAHTRDGQLATAPLAGIIAVRDRFDRAASLAAGRAWQGLHLAATLAGVALQPLNQPMEMADRDRQLGRASDWERRLFALTGAEDWQPTFSFRAGMAKRAAPPSPRRALRDIILA